MNIRLIQTVIRDLTAQEGTETTVVGLINAAGDERETLLRNLVNAKIITPSLYNKMAVRPLAEVMKEEYQATLDSNAKDLAMCIEQAEENKRDADMAAKELLCDAVDSGILTHAAYLDITGEEYTVASRATAAPVNGEEE